MCVFVWNWPLRVTHLEVMAPLGRQRATLLAQTLSLSFFALSLALSPPCNALLTSISHVLCFIFLFLLLSTFLTLWHAGMYDINRKRKDKRCIVSGPINLSRAFSSGWPVNAFVWARARARVFAHALTSAIPPVLFWRQSLTLLPSSRYLSHP